MLKIMLLPFVIALLGIVFIAVFSRKGSVVSKIAKEIQPSESNPLPWLMTIVVVLVGTSAWILVENKGDLGALFIALILLVFTALILFGIFAFQALQMFKAAVPLAAEIGEEFSDKERRAVLRRIFKFFVKFRKW